MRSKRTSWICAVAGLATSTVAMSQTAAAQQADTTEGARSAIQLEEIVVTAQRRTERLQEVPISLAVVSGDQLATRTINNFQQLAPLIPNLTIAKSPAADLIAMRGIGSSPGSPSLDQSVVMFIDGIYGGNARQFAAPFLDIERIEVLRGPQGALVGRNTSAGAINIVTRRPGTEFGGYFNALYNFDHEGPSVEGAVDLPISDSFRVRVASKYSDFDGYIENTYLGEGQPSREELIGRIVAVYDGGGPVSVTAKYENATVDQNGIPMQVISNLGYPLDFTKDTFLEGGPEYDDLDTETATLQFDVDLGGLQFVSITGYSAFENRSLVDADFYVGQFATAVFNQDFDQISQEFRLVSPSDRRVSYVIGAYYSTADLFEQRTTGVLFAPPASTYREFTQDSEVYSVAAQVTWRITDQWRLNVSGRYTEEKKEAVYQRFGGPNAATDFTGTLVEDIRDDLKKGRFDPAVSLQYAFNRDSMVYASYGKGSKSGGFQGAIGNATAEGFEFKPEIATSYEVGTKLGFPGLGYINFAGFYTVYKDMQVSAQIPTNGGLVAQIFTGNAPEARVGGLEADFRFILSSIFSIDGSLAWLPTAKYVGFTSGPCNPGQTPDGSLAGSCNLDGKRLGFAPKYSASLNLNASVPLASNLNLIASVSPRYQDDSYRDFTADPVTMQKAVTVLDARLGIGDADGRWEISVIGRNLTDELVKGFGSSGGLANTFLDPDARIASVEPPRNFSLQARINF
jgi:iron complex outermembrane receptor protein